MSIEDGPSFDPELLARWETLEGPELEQFVVGLRGYVTGLRETLAGDLDDETRVQLQEELEGLQDSLEAIETKLGPVRRKVE